MHNTIEKEILEAIIEVSKNFLKDDISVEVTDKCISKDCTALKNYAAVTYKGEVDLLFVLCLDDLLLNSVYKVFIPVVVSLEDKNEMMKEISNEIINTIAGLAISKFPKPYNNLELSPPLYIKKSEILFLKEGNFNIAKVIETSDGNFCCTIIKI